MVTSWEPLQYIRSATTDFALPSLSSPSSQKGCVVTSLFSGFARFPCMPTNTPFQWLLSARALGPNQKLRIAIRCGNGSSNFASSISSDARNNVVPEDRGRLLCCKQPLPFQQTWASCSCESNLEDGDARLPICAALW